MEPDTCGDDPLSITAKPPNLTPGLNAFTVIILSAISKTEELMYCIEEDPATTKFWVINKDPVIT
jgi:hypothetical protein